MSPSAILPPIELISHDVNVRIRVDRADAPYECEICSGNRAQHFRIGMSSHDLEALNRHLRDRMLGVAFALAGSVNTQELKAKLGDLAEAGYLAFCAVFEDPVAMTVAKELVAVDKPVSIGVVSERFVLPWELLYPVGPEGSVAVDNFWGIKHMISRIIPMPIRPGVWAGSVISPSDLPRLGLLT